MSSGLPPLLGASTRASFLVVSSRVCTTASSGKGIASECFIQTLASWMFQENLLRFCVSERGYTYSIFNTYSVIYSSPRARLSGAVNGLSRWRGSRSGSIARTGNSSGSSYVAARIIPVTSGHLERAEVELQV